MSKELKTLGLIGGMTWHSTADYYRHINEAVAERAGDLHSAPLILHSVDFEQIEELMRKVQWSTIGTKMKRIASSLVRAGVDGIAMTSNAIHKVADDVEGVIDRPFLHIVDPTAEAIKNAGFGNVALLGTAVTMSEEFYKGRLKKRHGIDVGVPEPDEQAEINRIIFEELGYGNINLSSKGELLRLIDRLHKDGSEGVILGCTELGEIINASDTDIPVFDTTTLHCTALANFILSK